MNQNLSGILCNALNEQGFIFQEKCAHSLEKGETGWSIDNVEYPVSLKDIDTRVDIILRKSIGQGCDVWSLVECKRADPEYVYWLFGSPGLPPGKAHCSVLVLEGEEATKTQGRRIHTTVEMLNLNISTYDAKSWAAVRDIPQKPSSKRLSNIDNIEKAFAQVLIGTSGFANEQYEQRSKDFSVFKAFFLPIVVTTANLYVAHYKLQDISIETGKLEMDKVYLARTGQPPEEVEWVLVDYGAGENVAPNAIPEDERSTDPRELLKYKTRSIFVVNSKHMIKFFSSL